MTIRQRIARLRKRAPIVIDGSRKRAHIVIDGEAVKGYSLPEPDKRDVAIAEREWGEHHATTLAEQRRTQTQRLAGAVAGRLYTSKMRELCDDYDRYVRGDHLDLAGAIIVEMQVELAALAQRAGGGEAP